MAAGDIVIKGDFHLGDKSIGSPRLVFGTVVLDGGNPTPVALTGRFQNVTTSPMHAVCNMEGSAATGVDPNYITSAVSGVTINIYAWKVNSKDNATFEASTDNSRLVNWIAIGPSA